MSYSHVLISRPGPEAAELASMVSGMGLSPLEVPAFRFEPGFPGLDFNMVWQAGQRRLAVFSSTRAVEFGLRQLPAGFLDDVEIAAIGPVTADALESAGYRVSIVPDGGFNSEALLAHSGLAVGVPGMAVIFAAPGGRQALFEGLQALGWQTHFAHVYRAVAVDPDPQAVRAIISSQSILSVWTSANALRRLHASVGQEAWEKIAAGDFLVTSDRLGELAGKLTSGRVFVTNGPGNEAIVQRLRQLI